MSNSAIKYEIKLQPSVIVILGVLALGVCVIAFAPVFSVKKADAAFGGGDGMIMKGHNTFSPIWQLNDGKVRYCLFIRKKSGLDEPVDCTDWKE